MSNKKQSPRQELRQHTGNGYLRGTLEQHPNGLSNEAINLCIDIVLRYCEYSPKRKRR